LPVNLLGRWFRFIVRLARPSTLRILGRLVLPGTTGIAEYGDLRLTVIDARPKARRNLPQLIEVVTGALKLLSSARQGFGELVTSHLHSVLAVPPGRTGASWPARAYGSTFEGPESRNSQYLACILVRSATIVRVRRDSASTGTHLDERQLSKACDDAQRRFLEQFPNVDEWLSYMGLDGPQ
jgi:hypothetical protein